LEKTSGDLEKLAKKAWRVAFISPLLRVAQRSIRKRGAPREGREIFLFANP
jgi:hypothetical protein